MTRKQLLAKLRTLRACKNAVDWLKSSDYDSLQSAWNACERPDWMLWLLYRLGADRKLMVTLACDCAETALPIWHKRYPKDDRPAHCIAVTRRWVLGTATIEEVREARRECFAAAYADADAADADATAAYADADAAVAAAADAAYAAYADAAAAVAAAVADAAYAYAADAAARKKANRRMSSLIRKRVSNPEEVAS